jgi:membrane associated rhomboid family serine protease
MSFQNVNEEEIPDEEPNNQSDPTAIANTPIYSYTLIACIVVVSIAQLTTNLDQSIDLAGFVKPDFLYKHDYWRIFTGGALHIGIVHLAFNSYALYSFGKLIEFLSNKAHLAIVFLISVVGGGLFSLVTFPEGTSAGASGGIVGFLGYLGVYAFKRRQLLSKDFLKNLLLTIGLNAFLGIFVLNNIDNFAHLGGLIAGAIYGFIQIPSDLQKDPRMVTETSKLIGMVSLGFFIIVSIFSILLILQIIRL